MRHRRSSIRRRKRMAEEEHHINEENLPLGFTFSFPCRQTGLANAHLDHWTKVNFNLLIKSISEVLSATLIS